MHCGDKQSCSHATKISSWQRQRKICPNCLIVAIYVCQQRERHLPCPRQTPIVLTRDIFGLKIKQKHKNKKRVIILQNTSLMGMADACQLHDSMFWGKFVFMDKRFAKTLPVALLQKGASFLTNFIEETQLI